MAQLASHPDRLVAEAFEQLAWTAYADGIITDANAFWRRFTGLDDFSESRLEWADVVHPDDVARVLEQFSVAARAGKPFETEYRFRRADGSYRWHLARLAPIRDHVNAVIGWAGTANDIEERRQSEAELRSSEARARELLDHASDIVYTLDLDGTIRSINSAVERVLGFRPDEVIGQSIENILAPDQLALTHEVLQRKRCGEVLSVYELVLLAKDGRLVTLEINSQLVVTEGAPVAIHGIARDVSTRQAARTERQERERQLRLSATIGAILTAPSPLIDQLQACAEALVTQLDTASARIWTVDEAENVLILAASAGHYTRLDGPHDRIQIGSGKIGLIAAERQAHLSNSVASDPDLHDHDLARREGLVAFAGLPLLVGGRLLGVLGVFAHRPLADAALTLLASVADVVAVGIERARIESAREAALLGEQAAREYAEAVAATLATVNQVGTLLAAELDHGKLMQSVTDAATALTGAAFGAFFSNLVDARGESYTLYTLAGAPSEAFADYPMPRNTQIFGPTFRGEGVIRLADVRADPRYGNNPPYKGLPEGHLPVTSYLAIPVMSRSGEVLGGLFFGHPEVGVFDERTEELAVGLAAHVAVAIDNARLYRTVHEAEQRYRGLFAGVADAILVADGERRYVDANPAAEALLGYRRDELELMRVDDIVVETPTWTEAEFNRFRDEEIWQGELDVRRKDGSTVTVEAKATVVNLPEGAIHLSALRDVSERRAVEQQRQAFIEAVSHDLRNPLTMIRAQAQLGQRRLRRSTAIQSTEMLSTLANIEAATRRMDDQLTELQDMVRLRAGQPLELRTQPTDLVSLCEAAVRDVSATTSRHRLRFTAEVDRVVGEWDPVRLRRVLDNLLSNAIKYSPDGGEIAVKVDRTNHTGRSVAQLTVRDDGIGIPAADLPYVFERYRRGSNIGNQIKGTGLGLAGVWQIITQHGGTVTAFSDEGRGSTFRVNLLL